MEKNSLTIDEVRTLRQDLWWVEPLLVVVVLGSFVVYTTWAALQNAYYYAAPYLSPFYSPCLSTNCAHVSLPLIGSWWNLSPAILILWIPAGFRATCYYYRKAYYRSFFGAPPACAVRDIARNYTGETRFPFVLQNMHRYFFWLASLVVVFLWWDAILAFRFPDGFGVGIGTLVLLVNAFLLSLYSFSCHSCRHMCGGHLDTFHDSPAKYRIWEAVSRLNEHHMLYAWISLIWVALTDLYVRLLSMGVISDVRLI
ncbi:MAG: succinate dehydrogenase [Deltaproteobacteria bacterium]|nr:succinate dehydrogenase [Deltaproteobacteria bacterium]